MQVIHLSDLHIQDEASRDAAAALFRHIVEHEDGSVPVIITGDIIEGRRPEREWELADEAFRELHGRPVQVCFGNHCLYHLGANDRVPYAKHAYAWLDRTLHLVADDKSWPIVNRYAWGADRQLTVIMANSCVGRNVLAQGTIGYAQRMRIGRECQEAKARGDQVLVGLHHHLRSRNAALRLTDAQELLHLVAFRCDVMLFGHLHQAAEWSNVWGIGGLYAADKSTDSMRYRRLTCGADGVWRDEWVGVKSHI